MNVKGRGLGVTTALAILALTLVLPRVEGATGVALTIVAVLGAAALGWVVAAASTGRGEGG